MATTIGFRIKTARAAAGLSYEALASACDASRQTVYNWEANRSDPRSGEVRAIAEACGVDAAWLLDGRGRAPRVAK